MNSSIEACLCHMVKYASYLQWEKAVHFIDHEALQGVGVFFSISKKKSINQFSYMQSSSYFRQ